MIQPPSCIEILNDPIVLLAEGLVDGQRFLCIRLGHFEVVLCRDRMTLSWSLPKLGDSTHQAS